MLFNSPLLTTWQRSEKSAFPPTSLVSLFLPFSFCHRLLSPLLAARRCSTPPVSHSHLVISLPHCSGPTLQHSGLDWSPVDDPARLWPTRPQPSAPDHHFYLNTSCFLSVCSDNIAEWVSPISSPVDPSLQNPFPAWHISQPEHNHLSLLADFSVWFSGPRSNTPPKALYTLKDFQDDKKKDRFQIFCPPRTRVLAIESRSPMRTKLTLQYVNMGVLLSVSPLTDFLSFGFVWQLKSWLSYMFPAHNRLSDLY